MAYVTYALLAILVAAFVAECAFALGPLKGSLQPSITTLEALGGLYWTRIVESGEWYRLLSATFLHGDLTHLLLNGFVLFYAGRRLEWVIGHAWFAAIYLISAVCGSVASLAINPHNLVGVGASGAIMGILGASVISSLHFAAGPTRTRLQVTAAQVLIPLLLPIWTTTRSGMLIDFGGHLGGAIGGALVAALMLLLWPRSHVGRDRAGNRRSFGMRGDAHPDHTLLHAICSGFSACRNAHPRKRISIIRTRRSGPGGISC